MNKKVKIEGKRIYLRTLVKEDASERYASWINDSEVNKFLDTKKTTVSDLKNYIDVKNKDPNCIFFGIFLKTNNSHIGNLKLEPIDFKEKKAFLGILIGEKDYWNKGYATEVLNTIVNYAFESLKLEEINLGVYKENKGAVKAYLKSHFEIYEETEDLYKMKIKRNQKQQ